MTTIHHIQAGSLHVPPGPRAICHCLLLQDPAGLALVDAGIGLLDVRDPEARIGREVIDAAGFQFREEDTAARRIKALGLRPEDVTHVLLTHGDPDHAGGLADFPSASVHLSEEELAAIGGGNPRYSVAQFAHAPRWVPSAGPDLEDWFGIEARRVPLGFESDVLLIPLFGHTLGHCGVAIAQGDRWVLHVGDAYYLRVELETDDHPVSQLAAMRADSDSLRRRSLANLRRLHRDHAREIDLLGYHDPTEFPVARHD